MSSQIQNSTPAFNNYFKNDQTKRKRSIQTFKNKQKILNSQSIAKRFCNLDEQKLRIHGADDNNEIKMDKQLSSLNKYSTSNTNYTSNNLTTVNIDFHNTNFYSSYIGIASISINVPDNYNNKIIDIDRNLDPNQYQNEKIDFSINIRPKVDVLKLPSPYPFEDIDTRGINGHFNPKIEILNALTKDEEYLKKLNNYKIEITDKLKRDDIYKNIQFEAALIENKQLSFNEQKMHKSHFSNLTETNVKLVDLLNFEFKKVNKIPLKACSGMLLQIKNFKNQGYIDTKLSYVPEFKLINKSK